MVLPKITMKSTDGKVSYEVYVEKKENNIYYFDRHIFNSFDMKKEYIFEVESADKRNTTNKKVNIVFGTKDLGLNTNKYEICTENDKLKFVFKTYIGEPVIELKELNFGKTSNGLGYIYGKIVYKEIINGTKVSSQDKPILVFKSADGKVQNEVYVERLGNDTYYFDRHIFNSLDKTKEYTFDVKPGDVRNTYNKEKNITLGTKKLATAGDYRVLTKDNKVYFEKDTYNGTPNALLKSLSMSTTSYGSTYIYGNIEYTEIINDVKTQTRSNPIIEFKSTDGKVIKEVYVNKISNNVFYFDRHLEGIDISKQYEFVVKTGSNLNNNKNTVSIKLGNKDLGLYGKYRVITEDTKVKMSINKEQYKGIDVSSWQGDIDWKQVASDNIDFAIIRVGYRGYGTGKIVLDSKFATNVTEAKKVNIDCGVYFATQAITEEEAIEEANITINNIKSYSISGPVVVDTESSEDNGRADNLSKELRTKIVKAFCQTIQNAGYTPAIYANKWWLTDNLDMSQLGNYDVWLAHYTTGAPQIVSDYKGNYTIWQYTSTGKVKGISTNVDLNIAYKKY